MFNVCFISRDLYLCVLASTTTCISLLNNWHSLTTKSDTAQRRKVKRDTGIDEKLWNHKWAIWHNRGKYLLISLDPYPYRARVYNSMVLLIRVFRGHTCFRYEARAYNKLAVFPVAWHIPLWVSSKKSVQSIDIAATVYTYCSGVTMGAGRMFSRGCTKIISASGGCKHA